MNHLIKSMKNNIWDGNPILRKILGICPALAVTNLVENAIVMSLVVLFVMSLSELTVSIVKKFSDKHLRILIQMLIISWYVIIVDILIKLTVPEISKSLGPYVGLIITNCLIMGRCEAYAQFNKPIHAFFDGIISGISFGIILIMIASIREILGFGTFLEIQVLNSNWSTIGLFTIPAGAFFVIGIFIWLHNITEEKMRGDIND